MPRRFKNREELAWSIKIPAGLALLIGIYLTSHVNYLLFHTIVEIFSIVVAFTIFVIAWNARSYLENQFLLFIGIAYLFIGAIDLLHTLSYKGMQIFTDYDYYANQLWILARFVESISIVIGYLFLWRKINFNPLLVFSSYLLMTGFAVASVFYWKIFPECFIEGQGQTAFKLNMEYLIILILAVGVVLLYQNRMRFEPVVFKMVMASVLFTIVSELAFTFYISNYGLSNLVGHYFKLFSFYLIYKAIIETGIVKPFELTFRELVGVNNRLAEEVKSRMAAEEKLSKTVDELKQALAEVNTLSGLLPVCASCKKVRDDKGYWNQIDEYISQHSDVQVSHGICPECAEKLYPGYVSKQKQRD